MPLAATSVVGGAGRAVQVGAGVFYVHLSLGCKWMWGCVWACGVDGCGWDDFTKCEAKGKWMEGVTIRSNTCRFLGVFILFVLVAIK